MSFRANKDAVLKRGTEWTLPFETGLSKTVSSWYRGGKRDYTPKVPPYFSVLRDVLRNVAIGAFYKNLKSFLVSFQ